MQSLPVRPFTPVIASSWMLAPLMLAAPAAAQDVQCFDRLLMLSALSEQWRERPVGQGLTSDGALVVITASADGETWTLIVVRPDGNACMIASGTAWETAPFPAPGVDG